MKSTNKKSSPLILKYIGEDFWFRPVYQDQFNRLWKDIELGDSETPSLYSVTNNEFDGEPLAPIQKDFIFQKPVNPKNIQRVFNTNCWIDYGVIVIIIWVMEIEILIFFGKIVKKSISKP